MLENPNLPILEVNAGYPLTVGDVLNLEHHFSARGKPGILVLPDDAKLELAASNAQFQPFSSLMLLEVKSEANEVIVEQVSWSQASALARVWCLQHNALDWQDWVAKEIARAVQQSLSLTAYLVFENHQVAGMMIAHETGFAAWLAGETRAIEALAHRLSIDFEPGILAVPFEVFPHAKLLDRYSIWLKTR